MIHVVNRNICKFINRIRLQVSVYGYAVVAPPSWKGSITSLAASHLYYMMRGSASITGSNSATLMMRPGYWYFIPSGYSFDFECLEEMEQIYFHLKLCDFDETDLFYKFPHPIELPADGERTDFLLHCLSSNNVADALTLQHAVYDVLLQMIENEGISLASTDYSPCVFNAVQYIKNNLSMKLTVSEISEKAFVSKSTLTKHFRNELSTSIGKYISDKVLFEAERLLCSSNLSVCDISDKFGFSDQFYFSRLFKEKFGMPPREYRKKKPL